MFSKQIVYMLSTIFISNILETHCDRPNSCKNYQDYYFIDFSKNCYYNPDVFAPTTEILTRHVGTYENHTVTTEDGYILGIFRIPKKEPKGVVILQPPLTSDSVTYVSQNNQSLAFLLANQGYDVWLPSYRGTFYSDRHVNLTTADFKYWNFSFHEIGLYDLPAIINYIKNETGRSDLIFIGQSMAVTSSVIYASLKPAEAKNSLKIIIGMAPPVFMADVKGPLKAAALFANPIKKILDILQIGSLFKPNSVEHYLFKLRVYLPFKRLIVLLQCMTFGWTPEEYDPELINMALSQNPRAFSTKTLSHYAQNINNDGTKFQMYDYGAKKNLRMYGSATAPEYPVEKIIVPAYFITSSSDTLATIRGSKILIDRLPTEAKKYGNLNVTGINHFDYFWGKNRMDKIYNHIFSLLNKIS